MASQHGVFALEVDALAPAGVVGCVASDPREALPQPRLRPVARALGFLLSVASLAACAADAPSAPGQITSALSLVATSTSGTTALLAAVDQSTGRAGAGGSRGSTYYVRTDGGDADQCDGRTDAAYPGKGAGKPCAWSHPFIALPPGGRARIDGGATLVIGPGSYMMGQGAPGTDACVGANCYMAAIPSGPSAGSPTRITGKAGTTPKLWGTEGARRILNLEGSSNVEIGRLEITDQSDCVAGHSKPDAACKTGAPHGKWARTGLYAKGSRNVRLHDLDIHGLAHTGVNAGGLSNWTVERVRINTNGRAGWDGNVGKADSSNSGQIVLRDVEIGWNGCGERWLTGRPWACWGQKTGGYGDGLGTYYTGGQWLIEDSSIHHNTSDGLDLRYLDGESSTRVTVRRLYAANNAGNQAKFRGNATIEDSVLIGHCSYFRNKPSHHMTDEDHCRAGGNALQLVLTPGDEVTVRRNTIAGEGGTLIGANEGDESARIRIQNNVLLGYPAVRKSGARSSAYYANKAPAAVQWADNLVWKVKNNDCPPGSTCDRDPKLANMTLAVFDPTPLPGNPLADRIGPPGQIVRALKRKARR